MREKRKNGFASVSRKSRFGFSLGVLGKLRKAQRLPQYFRLSEHRRFRKSGSNPLGVALDQAALSSHFSEVPSPEAKNSYRNPFRFPAREQTEASRAIFAMLFAFLVEAPHLLAECPAPLWPAPGSKVRLGNCSASRSSCQRSEPTHAAQRPRRCCLRSSRRVSLPVPGVSRILPGRSDWAGAVRWDLPVEDRHSPCQDPDRPGDNPKDRSTGKNNKDRARNTTGCSSRHTDIPIPNPNTATQSQIPIRNRILGPNIFRPSRSRRALRSTHALHSSRHDTRRKSVRRRTQSGLRRRNLHPRETLLRRLREILRHRRRGILLPHRDLHVGQAPAAATNCAQSSRRGQKLLEIRWLSSYHYPRFQAPQSLDDKCASKGSKLVLDSWG